MPKANVGDMLKRRMTATQQASELQTSDIVFFKMLLSVVSTVPSFPDVFLWMVLIISIESIAKRRKNYNQKRQPERCNRTSGPFLLC